MYRRKFLGLAGASSIALAGCIRGDTGGDGGGYSDWFSNVDGYDGEVDRTGENEVGIDVGTRDGLSFSPIAIIIDQGTTVTWKWTGEGGRHNVVERDQAFHSEYHDRQSATFEHAFDGTGTFPYYCEPHRSMGMKGGVRVE